jgi:acyl dehydratase
MNARHNFHHKLMSTAPVGCVTVTGDRIDRFGDISGDRNPVHFDDAAARAAGFKDGRIAHGILVATVIVDALRRKDAFRYASLESQTFAFKKPVSPGDALREKLDFVGVTKDGNYLLVTLQTNVEKVEADGASAVVIEGTSVVRVPRVNWEGFLSAGLIPTDHQDPNSQDIQSAASLPVPELILLERSDAQNTGARVQVGAVVQFSKSVSGEDAGRGAGLWAEGGYIDVRQTLSAAKTPVFCGLFSALLGTRYPGAIYMEQTVRYVDPNWIFSYGQRFYAVGRVLQSHRHHKLENRAVLVIETQVQSSGGKVFAAGVGKLLVPVSAEVFAGLSAAPSR